MINFTLPSAPNADLHVSYFRACKIAEFIGNKRTKSRLY